MKQTTFFLVGATVFLSTCPVITQAATDNRPDLVIAVTKNPSQLEPMASNSNVTMRFSANIMETMIGVDYKNKMKLKPGLATSWKRIDDRTLELQLRKGIKCHNGEDFTAEDVAFSFGPKRFLGESAPGAAVANQFLGGIESVKAIDTHTIRILAKNPDPLLEQRFANYMSNCICKDAFEAVNNWEQWSKTPVGTGPYKISEVRPDEYIKLEAFDDYWGEKAPAKSITFKVVPETSSRVAGLVTGEFDIITEIMPDQFTTIEKSGKAEVVGGAINNIRVLIFDTNPEANSVLQDPRVRRALGLAIDRQLLVDTIFAGKTGVPNGLQMTNFGDLYIHDFKAEGYNPEQAKALLKEAGYKGEEISYRYLQDYYTGEVATAQILAEMWRQVGLNVKLELKENWDQILAVASRKGRGIANWSNTAAYPDPLSQLGRNYSPDGMPQIRGFWSNETYNTALRELQGIDPVKRKAAMEKMLYVYDQEDPPGTYLYYLSNFYGKKKSFTWDATGTSFMDMRAGNLSFE